MRAAHRCRIVFSVFCLMLASIGATQSAAAATYKILHQFCADNGKCEDGFALTAPLIRAADGRLYGVANGGGAFGGGTVFRLRPAKHGNWDLTVLHNFCALSDCSDGFGPQTPENNDTAGNLYGIAFANVGDE